MKYMVYMGSSNFQLVSANSEAHLPIIQNWMNKNKVTGWVLNLDAKLLHYLEGEPRMLEEAYEFLNVYYGTISPVRIMEDNLADRLFSNWSIHSNKEALLAKEKEKKKGLIGIMKLLTADVEEDAA